MTRLVQLLETAANTDAPYATERHALSSALVLVVQVVPLGDVMTLVFVEL